MILSNTHTLSVPAKNEAVACPVLGQRIARIQLIRFIRVIRRQQFLLKRGLTIWVVLIFGGVTLAQGPPASGKAADFGGARAMEHVSRMVAMGPRTAGSPEGKLCGDYILRELKALGLKTFEDKFASDTPVGIREMRNIVAEIPGRREEFIILSGHYDTKL
jgi:hypothetical protein